MTSSSTRLSRVPSNEQQQLQYQQAMIQQQRQSNMMLNYAPTASVPAFQAMPSSVSRISAEQPIYQVENQVEYTPKVSTYLASSNKTKKSIFFVN